VRATSPSNAGKPPGPNASAKGYGRAATSMQQPPRQIPANDGAHVYRWHRQRRWRLAGSIGPSSGQVQMRWLPVRPCQLCLRKVAKQLAPPARIQLPRQDQRGPDAPSSPGSNTVSCPSRGQSDTPISTVFANVPNRSRLPLASGRRDRAQQPCRTRRTYARGDHANLQLRALAGSLSHRFQGCAVRACRWRLAPESATTTMTSR